MHSFLYGSPRFWLMNVVLTLALATVHFCVYVNLWGMALAAGEGGHTVPIWLGWPVMALGLPVMPLGGCLPALLPHSIRGQLQGQDGACFFYLLAGFNAMLFGAWTTVQARVAPSLFRILRRTFAARFATRRA